MFNQKKKFFKNKLKQIQYSIWDLEFKVNKSRQVREGIRQDRDRMVESIQKVEAAIKAETDKTKKKELEDQLTVFKDNQVRFESQMKMIDNEINGVVASQENPGQQGILETIQGLSELKRMVKDHIKQV